MNDPFSGRISVTPVIVPDLTSFAQSPFAVPTKIVPGVWLDVEPDTNED